MIKTILVLDTIEVLAANAISSYATIGVPAVTAIGGFLHAIERKLKQQGINIKLNNFAMLYKHVSLQVHKQGYNTSIKATANPSILKNVTGAIQRPPFNPEAKCHLQLSLLVNIEDEIANSAQLCDAIQNILPIMKLAGGDIIRFGKIYIDYVDEDDDKSLNNFIAKINPSFVLAERKDLMQQGNSTLDALLDNLAVYHKCNKTANDDTTEQSKSKFTIEWQQPERKNKGWIVPIAVGYQGISPLGAAKNTRDTTTPHRFAESIITLGEFKMPHRFEKINDMFWQYYHDAEANLYCYSQERQEMQEDDGND